MRKYTNQIMTNVQILLGMQQVYGAKLTSCQRPITERSHMPDLIWACQQPYIPGEATCCISYRQRRYDIEEIFNRMVIRHMQWAAEN